MSRTTHKEKEAHTAPSLDPRCFFNEDESLIYSEDGAKNIAMLKCVLTSLIKAHQLEGSIAGKIKKGWME